MEHALADLLSLGEVARASRLFFRVLQHMLLVGRPERGLELWRRYRAQLPAADAVPLASIMLASAYGYTGRYEEATRELALAVKGGGHPLAPLYADVTRAYLVDHFQGRSYDALERLELAARELEARRAEDDVGFIVQARIYRAYMFGHLGRWEHALRELPLLRRILEHRAEAAAVEQMAPFIRLAPLAGLGRWDDFAVELTRAESILGGREGTIYASRYHTAAAQLAARAGDRAEVAERVARARIGAPTYFQALILGDLALSATTVGLAETAREVAAEAQAAAQHARAPWAQAHAAIAGSVACGESEAGDASIARALELTKRFGFEELWSRRDRPHAARLLARALAVDLGPPGLAARLAAASGGEVFAECAAILENAPSTVRAKLAAVAGQALGADADLVERLLRERAPHVSTAATHAHTRKAARARPALRVMALGGFAVQRGEVLIAANAFGRERARALLAALLCASTPVHREQLLDWFWGHLPPDRALRAFHVTLYQLRRTLEPDLPRGAAGSVVACEGETYRVALGEADSFDLREFLVLARRAEDASDPASRLVALQAAERAYGGPLFPEWPYAEWAQRRREDVEEYHRRVLELLADELLAADEPRPAASRYRRLLGLEPEREAWHRGLMRAYARAGERALALRQYHACRAVLRRELGVEPSAETRSLYQHLLG